MDDSNDQVFTIEDAKRSYPKLFIDQEPVKVVAFELQPDHDVMNCAYSKLTGGKLKWAWLKIKELIKRNIVRKSNSPYASPCIIVPKDDGQFRLVQDYTQINEVTVPQPFPLPNVDELIASFSGCNYFSKVDLVDASYQVRLTEETKKFTAFVLPFGKYEMNRLPVGWLNTSAILQRTMTEILGEIPTNANRRLRWYIDDIIIGSERREDCLEMTHLVLQRLQQFNLRLKESKCLFLVSPIEALGRVTDGNYVSRKPALVEKILSAEKPFSLDNLNRFMGRSLNFKLYIANYADIVRPLDQLLRQYQTKIQDPKEWLNIGRLIFQWTEAREKAFHKMTREISSNPILHLPISSLPFHVITSVSDLWCGSSYFQVHSDESIGTRLIGFHSQNFKEHQLNYSVEEKECFTVVKALKHFPWYKEGNVNLDVAIVVHTDLQALKCVLKRPKAREPHTRWIEFITAKRPLFKQRTATFSLETGEQDQF